MARQDVGEKSDKRRARKYKPKSAGVADWMSVDGETIKYAIAAAGYRGGALRFGYTRDGGAYAIGVYGDGEPYTVYVPPADDIDGVLKDLGNAFRE